MSEGRERRRELRSRYEETPREAGVYLIRNERTGRVLLGSSVDLASARNRFEFAKATGSVGALDGRLASDARADGVATFSFEVLETLALAPDATPAEVRSELAALEELCAERLGDVARY